MGVLSSMRVAGGPWCFGYDFKCVAVMVVWITWMVAPFRWARREVRDDMDEIIARLQSVPEATASVGVVSLLGGIIEVCQHFPRPLFGLVDVFGWKPWFRVGSTQWWCPRCRPSIGSFTFGATAWSSCCFAPVLAVIQCWSSRAQCTMSARSLRRCLSLDRSSPSIYFPPPFRHKGGWCIDKGSVVEVVVLRRWQVSAESRLCCSI
jgi:hypothetical protein